MASKKIIKFSKEAILKDYKTYTKDIDLLKVLLNLQDKQDFTQEEVKKLLKEELKREVL